MSVSGLNSNMTVAEVLERWPETVPVFQDLKTACIGCAMAPFDTLADVARIYERDLEVILASLARAVETKQPRDAASSDGQPAKTA